VLAPGLDESGGDKAELLDPLEEKIHLGVVSDRRAAFRLRREARQEVCWDRRWLNIRPAP
jgi:hypothetical protein